jgi:hypothetical protein
MVHVVLQESPLPIPKELRKSRLDNLCSTDRSELYRQMAESWHHRDRPWPYECHYNDLARSNRRQYDLNYPCPQPKRLKSVKWNLGMTMIGTATQTMSGTSHLSSTDARFTSRYGTSRRLQFQAAQKKMNIELGKQMLERAAEGNFVKSEKFVAAIARMLLLGNFSMETIQEALKNVNVRTTVNPDISELEICLHL